MIRDIGIQLSGGQFSNTTALAGNNLSTLPDYPAEIRASAVAAGIKLANPKLKVFIVTGDGDGLCVGGNHLIHLCRRNVDVTVLLFNNRIYGLTKGQYSPTSEPGKITKSSPYGTIENPFNPIQLALSAGATFVASSIDREQKHLYEILKQATQHKGTSFVEIY